jgi:prevent-host-death family protein
MTHMETVGIRELQQHASRVVARAAAGESIVVTDRGRPVARLVPLGGSGLDALVAAGRVRQPAGGLADLAAPMRPGPGSPSLGEVLADLRRDER